MSHPSDADAESAPLLQSEGSHEAAPPQSFSARLQSALSNPSSLNGLEKSLAALTVFFLLLTATGFGLFAGEAVKLGQAERGRSTVTETATRTTTVLGPTTTTKPVPKLPGSNDEVCLTPTCVKVAAGVISALDETVDPCEDFYLFSNGGWLNSHPVPDDAGLFGIAQDIGQRNKRIIMSILSTTPSASLPSADLTNLHHLRSFHESCLDEDRMDRQGLAPLLEIVKEVVGAWRGESVGGLVQQESGTEWSVRKGKGKGRWDEATRKDRLTAALMFLHSREIPAIFEVYTEGDVAVDPKTLVLWLRQSGLGLPAKDYYKDAEVVDVYTEIIRASLKSIYGGLDESADFKELAEGVVHLEKAIAKVGLDVADLEDPKATYNSRNSTELNALFPLISFPNYFAAFTPRPSYPDPVIVTSPSYLENVTELITGTEADVLEAYFVFRTASHLGHLLGPKQTVRKELEWLSNFLAGIEEGVKPARGDVCLEALLENYGFLIGRYYIQQAFTGDSKEYAEDVIVATIQAFKDRLPELDWLDAETRAAAEEKADAITHKIGYPTTPDTMDPASLERYYSLNLPISSNDYFGNVLRSHVAEEKRKWVRVGKQMDKGMWDMIPSEVNAYYNPPSNEIAFPAGILQSPYFSKDWPEYMAFGAFGSVAGHELSHAFDQMGRQYNKDGKLVDWWTNATVARFEELQGCLLDQYAGYSVLDARGKKHHINSHFTNGEDMADAGGLSQSFRAWSDRFDGDKEGSMYENYLLPGLSYSREQLFYIAYAQGWARNIKPTEAVKRIRTDPHSPTNFRVIGPLSNDENFAKAFGCKVGQPMRNERQCKVW